MMHCLEKVVLKNNLNLSELSPRLCVWLDQQSDTVGKAQPVLGMMKKKGSADSFFCCSIRADFLITCLFFPNLEYAHLVRLISKSKI
jgi:hypothetical protein